MKRTVYGIGLAVLLVVVLSSCAIRRGVVHEVEQGQTLWRIAQVYDVRLETLMEVNGISDARRIKTGTRITIPGVSERREVPASPQRRVARNSGSNLTSDASGSSYGSEDSGSSTQDTAANTSDPSRSSRSARESSRESTESDPEPSASENQTSEPEKTETSSDKEVYFDPVWPCDGRLASRYDEKGGPTKRGIRIHTSAGSPVKAADEGNVKLAGEWEKMPDLGKIVIIFHSNDFTTVYAHLKSVKVSEGTKIERGQPIGTVGRSGDVSQPMCYFEVRYKLEPRDPLIFLGESS